MTHEARLTLIRDDTGKVTGEIPWQAAEMSHRIGVEATEEYTLEVPEEAYRAHFIPSPGLIVWIGYGDTELVPAGAGVWTTINGELNPGIRPMVDPDGNKIETLRFLSENEGFINVVFYPQNATEPTVTAEA